MSLLLSPRRIREMEEDIYISADAIGINQDDNAENECQIRLMQDIFKMAIEVYAWLGLADSDSRIALETTMVLSEDSNGLC
ncbi:hypothetical protein AJ80_05134 [Polytolypa hystricis UAMH7299]|uniref:Heterokaryon incompatibility domain-containing protein n=1 Tax=Polytolypa hystricis (strain UAMH7299) TaxID=1447883 RepID=A0A2B7Y6X4_POLH7|nr:hypothetical protein AJ80_05134 [Polytolypa hystricis UAMH7299]